MKRCGKTSYTEISLDTLARAHTLRLHQICPDSHPHSHSFIHSLNSQYFMCRFILAAIRILAYNRIENIKFTDKWGNKQVLLSSVLVLLPLPPPLLLIQFYVWQFDMMMCFSVRFVFFSLIPFRFVSFRFNSTADCMCVMCMQPFFNSNNFID